MTALTENTGRNYSDGDIVGGVPLAKGAQVFEGSLLEIDGNGNVQAATKGNNKTYFGVAQEGADNTGGNAGDVHVTTRLAGMFRFAKTGTAVRGKTAYVADDDTVTDVAAGATACGRIVDVRGSDVMVLLSR